MIAYIEGRLLEKTQRSCVIVTNCGIGYELFLTERDLNGLPERGEQLFFHVATVVREDSITLYGFLDFQNRCLFNLLLSIPKLGPRTSLALLSFFTPINLVEAVNRSDSQAIAQVPGIGAKSAARIILDLKDKLRNTDFNSDNLKNIPNNLQPSAQQEVLAVLTGLGYTSMEVSGLVANILKNDPDLDTASAVRMILKELGKQKS